MSTVPNIGLGAILDIAYSGEKRIVFNSPGLLMRDDTTGVTYKVVQALVVVHYELIEDFIAFKLVSYSNSPSGELITDAAIADLNLGGNKGKLMIVYKENEGGQVAFIPEGSSIT